MSGPGAPARPGGRELLAGLDLGTTETKALLIDAGTGARVGFARRATRWSATPDGVQTDADALVGGALDALTDALDTMPGGATGRVRGIGLTGLAESGVVLDAEGRVRTPVIAWHDLRGAQEIAALAPDLRAAFPGVTGLALNAQCTLSSLLWLHARGLRIGPGEQWLNVPEYLAHTLGGARATEPSLAARTGLVDAGTGAGWPAALALLGAGPGFLPPVRPAGHDLGPVTHPAAPAALRGARITVAGHDHPVAAVGAGATGPDTLFNSCGTADVLLRGVPRTLSAAERGALVAAGYSAGAHVLPGHTVLIGSLRAGLLLGRVLTLLGRDHPAGRHELDGRWTPGPAPSGVRVDGADITATEITLHLTGEAGPDQVWAAALAHLGAATATLLAAAERIVGPHRDALAAGGWTRLRAVRATKAAVIPRLRFADLDQPGALGAARFAAHAAGLDPNLHTTTATDGVTTPAAAAPAAPSAHDQTGTPTPQEAATP